MKCVCISSMANQTHNSTIIFYIIFYFNLFYFSKKLPAAKSIEKSEKANKALASLLIMTGLLITCFTPVFNSYRSEEAKKIASSIKEIDTSEIQEAKKGKQKQNYTETKEDIDSADTASQAKRAGEMVSQRPQVTETITREMPKINRNDTVTIKHVMSGKSESMKFKKAESMIASGEWVLVNE